MPHCCLLFYCHPRPYSARCTVLLSDDRRLAKIADLGLCRALSSDNSGAMSVEVGTPAFTAPEALGSYSTVPWSMGPAGRTRREPYDERADIWSIGCVLVCMDRNHKLPYDDQFINKVQQAAGNGGNIIQQLVSGQVRPSVCLASPFHSLVRDCCKEAVFRPTASELVARLLEKGMEEACKAQE